MTTDAEKQLEKQFAEVWWEGRLSMVSMPYASLAELHEQCAKDIALAMKEKEKAPE